MCPAIESAAQLPIEDKAQRNSSGSFAIFAAIRRASSLVSIFAADRRSGSLPHKLRLRGKPNPISRKYDVLCCSKKQAGEDVQ
jgi:hypothetical protein